MAYDREVAERIRTLLSGRSDVAEQKLFGGLCFMVRGHMCCAVSGRGGLLVRLGPDAPAFVFNEPHAAPMEMRGRIMADYVRVAPEGYRSASDLKKWVARAIDFVATLPKKAKKTAAKKASVKKKAKAKKGKK
jgi:TfoX/Sxy family transcriptional regulator of competence genes